MIVDPDELTPVELHGRRWYKRDDLFQPYDDVPLSGGKVRQAIELLGHARERIVDEHGGVVLTTTGVHSPQGLIIARVARELGLKCVIFIGATSLSSALQRHPMLVRALRAGAEIDTSAGVAYETSLGREVERWRREHDGAGYFVRFGINLEDDPDAIVGSTAAQCANLPDVERIVIAVGAGITAAGIIIGAAEHRPEARVVCVQIAGYDRQPLIDRIVDGLPYEWHTIKGIPYSRLVQRSTPAGLGLDPIYEAKAHDWMIVRERDDESVAFWVVGDSSLVRAG